MCAAVEHTNVKPLRCCEYIDHNNERNHILSCFCNCIEFDTCCERLVTCQTITRKDVISVMGACLDRIRCPGRGGAFTLLPVPCSALIPFVVLPLVAVSIVSYCTHIAIFVWIVIGLQVLMASYMTRKCARSRFLYFWTIASVTYTIVLFECSVTPLLEIRWDENLVMVILSALSLFNFHLTRTNSSHIHIMEGSNGCLLGNGTSLENICTVCRVKVHPRAQHCPVCQFCVPRHDQHCFWLDCCIGENNQGFFILGLVFAIPALVYGSLLILTTVCRPIFRYGILVPSDCSDVADHLEMGLCYCCAVYCLGLAALSAVQLLWHLWLVSRGVSGGEWQRNKCSATPYSRGCCRNWLQLIRSIAGARH